MMQTARKLGIVLYELGAEREQVEQAQRILNLVPQLSGVLQSPVIGQCRKQAVIGRIFSGEGTDAGLVRFLRVICERGEMGEINDIFAAYYQYWDEKRNIKRVRCTFAKEPQPEQLARIRAFLQERYHGKELVCENCVDRALLGGVVILAGHEEFDWSYANRLGQLERMIAGN